jgi:hypothetical protein
MRQNETQINYILQKQSSEALLHNAISIQKVRGKITWGQYKVEMFIGGEKVKVQQHKAKKLEETKVVTNLHVTNKKRKVLSKEKFDTSGKLL